ncbi:MAG: hypothetical protein KVP17_001147 [Porospora cf. gigantea B]|nr:MAG: hypothetical protein KVP17_001147 [Porospora cf. gigantea B]
MNQDERHKASEKVKSIISEYLRRWEAGLITSSFKPDTAPDSHLDPPNSSFVSVLRNGEWRRLPASLVVEGDIFKLRPGDVFPVTACPVMLKKVPYPPGTEEKAG